MDQSPDQVMGRFVSGESIADIGPGAEDVVRAECAAASAAIIAIRQSCVGIAVRLERKVQETYAEAHGDRWLHGCAVGTARGMATSARAFDHLANWLRNYYADRQGPQEPIA